jgi:hypothetical protein
MLTTTKATSLFRQSYTRGVSLLGYGVIWLALMLAGYWWLESLFAASTGIISNLMVATVSAALAGGVGGATAMVQRLVHHVAVKQDLPHQSTFSYLVQPIVGVIIGLGVLYVISLPVALLLNWAANQAFLLAQVLASSNFTAVQLLLAWTAGFYQQRGFAKLKAKISRRPGSGHERPVEGPKIVVDEDSPDYYKVWYAHRRQVRQWSYSYGLFLYLYGGLWFIGLLAAYLAGGGVAASLERSHNAATTALVLAALPAAVAGGLGGLCSLFYELYQHISVEQDFHRQHLISYLAQPILGSVFGVVMYLLLASGYLTFAGNEVTVVDSLQVVMLQMTLGWLAGFRQQAVLEFVEAVVRYVVALIKTILTFFNPKTLINQMKRDKALAEVREYRELFETIEEKKQDAHN